MLFHPTQLQDAVLIEPEKREDARGFFARIFCAQEFAAQGLETHFPQQNMSGSRERGTLRGMHWQRAPHGEVKLVRCTRGAICDIIVDLRPDSASFKRWQAFELTQDNHRALYVPKGFAHGFQALTGDVEVSYLVSAPFAPQAEAGLRWDDPALAISWPMAPSVLSQKDRDWPDFVG